MLEIREGVPTESVVQSLTQVQTSLKNSGSAMTWEDGQRYFLLAVENLEAILSLQFNDESWSDRVHSDGYWAIREMSEATPRPRPLLSSEANRLIRWLDDTERELKRITEQDEWDESGIPRIVLDTSALVREGAFDSFDWARLVGHRQVRLIIPILVVRELDDLKNYGKSSKARPRLRKMMQCLDGHGRGPAELKGGITLELLMDPPGHIRVINHDDEIIRRATYLQGRRGGSLKIITGDYTMLFIAQAEGIPAELTPAELNTKDE
jgi:rRNA-processing protein FCF1